MDDAPAELGDADHEPGEPDRPEPARSARPGRAEWFARPRNRIAAGIAVVALLAGALIGLLSSSGHQSAALPPTPPGPAATATAPHSSASARTPPKAHVTKPFHCAAPAGSGLAGATPVQICIPSIRVDASVMQLGLNPDRTVQVPALSQVGDAGWYKYSAAPGNVGPTVILGHIDSAQYGEGVFFKLGTLHAGDQVVVARQDAMVATFRVDKVAEIPKSRFPTQAVYGRTAAPALRLVTCGGAFDAATGNYLDNIIVYGTLLSLRHR